MNLVGIVVPGPRAPAVPGRFLRFRNGAPVSDEAEQSTPLSRRVVPQASAPRNAIVPSSGELRLF